MVLSSSGYWQESFVDWELDSVVWLVLDHRKFDRDSMGRLVYVLGTPLRLIDFNEYWYRLRAVKLNVGLL